jgi:hypothetical protein
VLSQEIRVFNWNELIGRYLPLGMTAIQLKDQLIKEQFGSETTFRNRCFAQRPSQEILNMIKSFEFTKDPATGESVLAYPGITRKYDSEVYYGLAYFLSKEEAEKSTVEALGTGDWTDLGKRWWKCPDGHTTRVPKDTKIITCDTCKARHEI